MELLYPHSCLAHTQGHPCITSQCIWKSPARRPMACTHFTLSFRLFIIIFQAARPSCAQPTPYLARERGGLSPRSRTGTASPCSSRLRGHPLDCVTTDTARLIASMLPQTAYAAFPFVARKAGFCWGLCAKKRAYMLLSFPQTSSPAQAPVNSQA